MQINLSLSSLISPDPGKSYALNHFLLGLTIPLILDDIGLRVGWNYLWIPGAILILGWSIYKEFFWDPKHESKEISGGPTGDIEDFLEYLIGLGAFLLIRFA